MPYLLGAFRLDREILLSNSKKDNIPNFFFPVHEKEKAAFVFAASCVGIIDIISSSSSFFFFPLSPITFLYFSNSLFQLIAFFFSDLRGKKRGSTVLSCIQHLQSKKPINLRISEVIPNLLKAL